jgi:pyrroloquinoline quinone biosynthesis protein D
MSEWTDESRPALTALYRMQWEEAQQCWVLLYPEGMVKLNAPAAEILKRCNGETPVRALVADVQATFGEADLRADVLDFLEQAHGRGWIR